MNIIEFKMRQALPLDVKIMISLKRIEDFIRYSGREHVYVSFSGGKDSTVLAILVHMVDKTIPLVFSDTGLEFPEIRDYAFNFGKVIILKPSLTHVQTITRYGYPVISKKVSSSIYKVRHQDLTDKYRNYLLNGDERGKAGMIPKRHQHLIYTDFEVGGGCCDVMKKRVFHRYEKSTGRTAFFTGETADESLDRQRQYLKNGCNAFERKAGAKSTPLAFWTENDILEFLRLYKIELAKVYGDIVEDGYRKVGNLYLPKYRTTGCDRTGCVFCAYGAHKEGCNNRFVKLKESHPQMYDYCMRGGKYNDKGMWVPDKGLGMAHVLETIGVAI